MIKGFEELTKELTKDEMALIPIFIEGFKGRRKDNPVTNKRICEGLSAKGYKITEPRVRKIIHALRTYDVIPFLISTSQGYYIDRSLKGLNDYIESLDQRINSIKEVRDAMQRQKDYLLHNEQTRLF